MVALLGQLPPALRSSGNDRKVVEKLEIELWATMAAFSLLLLLPLLVADARGGLGGRYIVCSSLPFWVLHRFLIWFWKYVFFAYVWGIDFEFFFFLVEIWPSPVLLCFCFVLFCFCFCARVTEKNQIFMPSKLLVWVLKISRLLRGTNLAFPCLFFLTVWMVVSVSLSHLSPCNLCREITFSWLPS